MAATRESSSLTARLLARWNRRYPPPPRPIYFETTAYRAWLEGMADELYRSFYSRFTDFEGKRILDLACGYGGKSVAYHKYGPEMLCGVDIEHGVLKVARDSAPDVAAFAGADAGKLPFADGTFDVVVSDDGFDHFKETGEVLREIVRVLKPGGVAFVTFVPYYSRECSHMNEYLRVPWHHVLFSRRTIRQALELVADEEARTDPDASAARSGVDGVFDTFTNKLSRLSIRRFRRLLRDVHGARLVRLRTMSRMRLRPLTYVPLVEEFVADTVCCVLEKDSRARVRAADVVAQRYVDARQDAGAVLTRASRSFARARQ
jgi:ubiquinone/menaquinone biosynthesis C-methylase UbiE